MEQNYLPGDFRTRVYDLMSEKKISARELADETGIEYTRITKILNGTTQKVSDNVIIALARFFRVSSDFLLGLSNTPGRRSYEIAELGLSVDAARNLYTGRVNAEVVNRLLENPRFSGLTRMISVYFDDSFADGFAAQNQLYQSVSDMLSGVPAAQKELQMLKLPPYQADLTRIQNQFLAVLKEIKKDMEDLRTPAADLTQEQFEQMKAAIEKDSEVQRQKVSPEQITELIVRSISGLGLEPQLLERLSAALNDVFYAGMRKDINGKIQQ